MKVYKARKKADKQKKKSFNENGRSRQKKRCIRSKKILENNLVLSFKEFCEFLHLALNHSLNTVVRGTNFETKTEMQIGQIRLKRNKRPR